MEAPPEAHRRIVVTVAAGELLMKNSTVYALLLLAASVPTAEAGAQDESLSAAPFGRVGIPATAAAKAHAEGRRSSVRLGAGAALALATTAVGGETGTDVGPLFSGCSDYRCRIGRT
jgi:hypothetical protein